MSFTNINGFKIFYEIEGKGEPVFLLHHGFGCAEMWKDIYPCLSEKGYQVVMYDRRGYGKSARGDDFTDFYRSDEFRILSMEELEHLRDFLGIESFHIVGQCEGGVVGADYSASYPGRVKSLVTASTQCHSPTDMVEFNRTKFAKPFGELDSHLIEKFMHWHGSHKAEENFNLFRTYGGAYGRRYFDLRPVLKSVKCPALVMYPDRSALFEIEQAVDFYRSLPMGELAVIPQCGHNTYEQKPGEYIRILLDFLGCHSS